MKGKYILRLLAGSLIIMSTALVNPICAKAEWEQDNKGWRYSEGNHYSIWWKLIDGQWYYFSSDGYMQTGWTEYINCDVNENIIGSTYYYLDSNGLIDESKTTQIRPKEIQVIYDKLINFEPDMKNNNEDLYFNSNVKNIGLEAINKIRPDIKECYVFDQITNDGAEIDALMYDDKSKDLIILNQGNYFITDTNSDYSNLNAKGNYIKRIRNWTKTQRDFAYSIYEVKEEKNSFIINKYSYDYKNNYKINFVRSYVYDKASGQIK